MDKDALARIIFDAIGVVAGIAVTSLAAGPVLSLFIFGRLATDWPANLFILGFSATFGLLASFPASLVNAAVLSVLARFKLDAFPISLIVGSTVGLLTAAYIEHGHATGVANAKPINPEIFIPYAVTGALMGALYWVIAILPGKLYRAGREAASAQPLEQAIQNAIEQKRDRRIPWDGRIPPE